MVDSRAELTAKVGRVAHSTVPVADNGLGDEGSEVVVVIPADALDRESNVGSRDGVVTESDFGSDELRSTLLLSGNGDSSRGGGLVREPTKVLLSQSDELLMRDATGANKNHAIGRVIGLDVVDEVVAADGLDVLLGAEDSSAKGLALVSGGMEVVENNLLQLLVNFLLFAQDHVTLALDGAGLESRVLEDVSEDVDGLGDVGVERLGVVDGVFPLEKLSQSQKGCFNSGTRTEV